MLVLFVVAELATPNTADDDYAISVALSGLLPDSGLCLFVDAALSRLVLALGGILHGVNVFMLVLYAVTFLAAGALVYEMLTRGRSMGLVLAALGSVMLLALPACTFHDNFSNVSAFAFMVGGTLVIMEATEDEPSYPLCVIGVVLGVCGFALRFYSALVSSTFLAVLLVARLHSFVRSRPKMGFPAARVAWLVVPLVLCGALFAYDAAAWSEPEWAQWKTLNEYRSLLVDYPMPSYDEVADEVNQMGLSEIDYEFATSFRSGDVEVFTPDVMRALSELADKNGQAPLFGPGGMAQEFLDGITSSWPVVLALLVMVMCMVVSWKCLSRIERVGGLAMLALAFAECAFLVFVGRYLDRVSSFIWCDAVLGIGALACCSHGWSSRDAANGRASRLLKAPETWLGAAVAVFSCLLIVVQAAPLSPSNVGQAVGYDRESRLKQSPIASYVSEHDEDIFVFDAVTGTKYEEDHSLRLLPSADDCSRVLFFGGWSTGSPYSRAMNEQVKTGNPLKALVEDERVKLVAAFEDMPDEVEQYLEYHYYDDVRYRLVGTIAANDGTLLGVYEYELVGGGAEEPAPSS